MQTVLLHDLAQGLLGRSGAYFGLASGSGGPIGSFWMAFIAGAMSNAMIKPEFALTISSVGSFVFAPGSLGDGGIECWPGFEAGKTSKGS